MVFSGRGYRNRSPGSDGPLQRRNPGRRRAHLRDRAEKFALTLLQPRALQCETGTWRPPLPRAVRAIYELMRWPISGSRTISAPEEPGAEQGIYIAALYQLLRS